MEQVLMSAKGINGQLELLETKIRIKRKGGMAFAMHGWKGDKEILLSHITAIQFKKASWVASGYIQFSFRGGQEAKGGLYQAGQDENTVMFWPNQAEPFHRIKEAIEVRMDSMDKRTSGRGGRYCVECGRSIPFDANRCPYCGHKYETNTPPQSSPPPANLQQPQCSYCKHPLRYITQYQRWYCDSCRQYR